MAPENFVYDPSAPDFQERLYDIYKVMRDEYPCYYNPELDFYALTRFADVWSVMGDWKEWSSEGVAEGAALLPQMIYLDPPRHDLLRSLVSRAFTPRRMTTLEPRVRQVARALVDEMATQGTGDMVEGLASPLPNTIMGELIGVPSERLGEFCALTEGFLGLTEHDEIAQLSGKIYEVFAGLLAERRKQPTDDLMSALLLAEIEGERLHEEELLGFCFLLLVAGNDTTTNLIGYGGEILANHRDQRAELAKNPGLLRDAVEEMLRYESPTQVIPRTATKDVELYGVTIPKGARVQMQLGAANRDEREFVDAHRFDIHRKHHRNIAFGVGLHFCLGAPLARLEGRIAFEELLARIPEYEIGAPQRIPSNWARSLKRLPLSFEPTSA